MTLLVVGESVSGALLQSLLPGLRLAGSVSVLDIWGPGVRERAGLRGRAGRRIDVHRVGARVIETVRQIRPSAVLIIKGRGVGAGDIERIQRQGVPVACYYPDNPWWTLRQEPDAKERLVQCDLAITFAQRIADRLDTEGARTAVVPFGYDHRWFPLRSPDAPRNSVTFLGTWSNRRQRYLSALTDLDVPLIVHGTGWNKQSEVPAGAPITETDAGAVLGSSIVGINLLHPQCAGAHNMRTREVTACGALELTDPGSDGSPLVDGESCRVFTTPEELRRLVREALENRDEAVAIAAEGQRITEPETYVRRGAELRALLESRL